MRPAPYAVLYRCLLYPSSRLLRLLTTLPHTLTSLPRSPAPPQVGEKQLMTVLEPDCLHTVGLLRDKQMWEKKLIKHSTRVNYTIPK